MHNALTDVSFEVNENLNLIQGDNCLQNTAVLYEHVYGISRHESHNNIYTDVPTNVRGC